MRFTCIFHALVAAGLAAVPTTLSAQDSVATPLATSVPHVVQFSGALPSPSVSAPVTLRFALYAAPTGGEALWAETQTVTPDAKGRYAVLLGSATEGGLPQAAFSNAEAKWLGITAGDAAESARVVLVATPYALKASDAETLAGHSATDFVLAGKNGKPNANADVTTISGSNGVLINGVASTSAGGPTVALSLDGNYLGTLGNSLYALKNSVVGTLAGVNGVTVTHSGTAYTATLDGTYLGNLALSCCAVLANNNTLTGTNTFTKPITFASSQTFPGVATLSGADNFTNAMTVIGTGSPQLQVTTSVAGGTALTGTANGSGMTSGVSGFGNYGGYFQSTSSSNGYGVVASSSSYDGIYTSTSGTGEFATGMYAINNGAGSGSGIIAVNGAASNVSGISYNGAAIWADTNITHGANDGAEAALMATALNNYSIVAVNNGSDATIFSNNLGGSGMEVFAATGYGVYAKNTTDTKPALWAVANSSSSTGAAFNGYGAALWADTGYAEVENGGSNSYGALLATADSNFAGFFENNSSGAGTIYAHNAGSAGVGNSVPVITAQGSEGACGINSAGDVACSGRLRTLVPMAGTEKHVEVYSMQSAENWIEDFGSAKLENGVVAVAIDPAFAGVVNARQEYHVFLTAKGDCKGLYVARESETGFEVREMGGGASSIAFDYRIVAKRAGHESERLKDATEEMARLTARPRKDQAAPPMAAPQPEAGHPAVTGEAPVPPRPGPRTTRK